MNNKKPMAQMSLKESNISTTRANSSVGFYWECSINNTSGVDLKIIHRSGSITTFKNEKSVITDGISIRARIRVENTHVIGDDNHDMTGMSLVITPAEIRRHGAIYIGELDLVIALINEDVTHPYCNYDPDKAFQAAVNKTVEALECAPHTYLSANDPTGTITRLFTMIHGVAVEIPVTDNPAKSTGAVLYCTLCYNGNTLTEEVELDELCNIENDGVLYSDKILGSGFVCLSKRPLSHYASTRQSMTYEQSQKIISEMKNSHKTELENIKNSNGQEQQKLRQEVAELKLDKDGLKLKQKELEQELEEFKIKYTRLRGIFTADHDLREHALKDKEFDFKEHELHGKTMISNDKVKIADQATMQGWFKTLQMLIPIVTSVVGFIIAKLF